jgi:hypothetical protein
MSVSEISKHPAIGPVVETVIIAGEAVELRLEDIPIEKLILDEDNPREMREPVGGRRTQRIEIGPRSPEFMVVYATAKRS